MNPIISCLHMQDHAEKVIPGMTQLLFKHPGRFSRGCGRAITGMPAEWKSKTWTAISTWIFQSAGLEQQCWGYTDAAWRKIAAGDYSLEGQPAESGFHKD